MTEQEQKNYLHCLLIHSLKYPPPQRLVQVETRNQELSPGLLLGERAQIPEPLPGTCHVLIRMELELGVEPRHKNRSFHMEYEHCKWLLYCRAGLHSWILLLKPIFEFQ